MKRKLQTIYEYFSDYSEEQINDMLSYLSLEEKLIIQSRFGNNLHNPIPQDDWGEKKSTKLKDGSIIREALQYSDIDKVIEIIQNKSGGLKGHTFIAIHDKLYALELTSRHNAELIELSNEDLVVRTNHGVSHTTAGYQAGLSYKSSAIRKQTAQKQMAKTTTPESMLDNLRTAFYKKDSQLNMKRDTKTLWTSSQILLDTNNLVLVLAAFKNKTT